MTELREGTLKLDASAAKRALKFDDASKFYHNRFGMLPVDFVIETSTHYLFVEIKDPEGALFFPEKQKQQFFNNLKTDYFNQKIYRKCRDSFLYFYFSERLSGKPIICILLLCAPWVDTALRIHKATQISSQLPTKKNSPESWENAVIETFQVLSLEEWNKYLPKFPLERIS